MSQLGRDFGKPQIDNSSAGRGTAENRPEVKPVPGQCAGCGVSGPGLNLVSKGVEICDSCYLKGGKVEEIFDIRALDAVEGLLDSLSNVNEILISYSGYTALHLAARCPDVQKLRAVLRRNPDTGIRSRYKLDTPLHTTVAFNHPDGVDALLDAGANIEATSHAGLRPLHYAAMNGHAEVARRLLKPGANVHATEANRATALHAAAYHGHIEVVRELLKCGADPNQLDVSGFTPCTLAQRRSHEAILALLQQR